MEDDNTLRSQWAADHAEREFALGIARECSRLTDPTVLPFDRNDKQKTQDQFLPQNYQSLGSEGIITLEGKMVSALFPPGLPWFKLNLAEEILNNPEIPDEKKQAALHDLMVQELIIVSALEAGDAGAGQEVRNTFRTAKRQAICQLLVTGDVLEFLDDDFKLTVYRRDQYVTRRDNRGNVLYHIVRETIDPFSLSVKQFNKSGLDRKELEKCHVAKRMKDLYTQVEWMPREKKWKITQELNDREINSSIEPVSPYFSTPFKLSAGEHYGRGLVELHMGDLYSYDQGALRMLDYMELCSKMLTVLDQASVMRERDFAKPTGSVVRGRVVGGVVQDAAMYRVEKVADFSVVAKVMESIAMRLAKVFLSASGSVRDSERTTAYEIARATIAELEGAIGGVSAPLSDYQHIPLINRVIHQLRKQNKLPTPAEQDAKSIKVSILTGIAALADLRRADELRNLVVDAQALGDVAVAELNIPVVLAAIARYRRINEPGIIKSPEQKAQERQEAIELATQAAAAEKAVDVTGNVAEAKLAA